MKDLQELLPYLSADEKEELDNLIVDDIWLPLPGPQTEAYYCRADELFYGGAAGGGKTDLLLGCALTNHHRSIIFRKEATQLPGMLDRLHVDLLKSRDGWNGKDKIQQLSDGRKIEFGSMPNLGDEQKYQGRPHDLLGFDEITHFLKSQYTYVQTWLRTVVEGYRCRIIATGNPPTTSDGEWVIQHWGPWLDELHPKPAAPGEIRYYAMIDGEEYEVPNGDPINTGKEIIKPRSRTFLPSSVEDNPFLMDTGYKSQLQSLPEPLRSQMLNGDFSAGLGDDPWQVLPTAWVKEAQDRWTADGIKSAGPMDSMGVDCSRGGPDETILSRRHGVYFDELLEFPGHMVPNGPAVVSLVISHLRDGAPVHVDVIGIGSSVYDHMVDNNMHAIAVNGAEGTKELDKTQRLKFRNVRAMVYWRLREIMDPKNGFKPAIPPCPKIRADLCAPRWQLTSGGILIENKEDLIKRIGRSPDRGDAIAYANICTPKRGFGAVAQPESEWHYD